MHLKCLQERNTVAVHISTRVRKSAAPICGVISCTLQSGTAEAPGNGECGRFRVKERLAETIRLNSLSIYIILLQTCQVYYINMLSSIFVQNFYSLKKAKYCLFEPF